MLPVIFQVDGNAVVFQQLDIIVVLLACNRHNDSNDY